MCRRMLGNGSFVFKQLASRATFSPYLKRNGLNLTDRCSLWIAAVDCLPSSLRLPAYIDINISRSLAKMVLRHQAFCML